MKGSWVSREEAHRLQEREEQGVRKKRRRGRAEMRRLAYGSGMVDSFRNSLLLLH